MNRHTLVYLVMSLFIGLTMVSLLFGNLPLATAGTSMAPVGLTETFTPTNTPITPAPTNTPTQAPTLAPTITPAPTNTPTLAPTNTPTPTGTPIHAPTATPTPITPAPTDTPALTGTPAPTDTPTPFVGLPLTGDNPQGGVSPLILVLMALAVGTLGALAFGVSNRAHRPTRR